MWYLPWKWHENYGVSKLYTVLTCIHYASFFLYWMWKGLSPTPLNRKGWARIYLHASFFCLWGLIEFFLAGRVSAPLYVFGVSLGFLCLYLSFCSDHAWRSASFWFSMSGRAWISKKARKDENERIQMEEKKYSEYIQKNIGKGTEWFEKEMGKVEKDYPTRQEWAAFSDEQRELKVKDIKARKEAILKRLEDDEKEMESLVADIEEKALDEFNLEVMGMKVFAKPRRVLGLLCLGSLIVPPLIKSHAPEFLWIGIGVWVLIVLYFSYPVFPRYFYKKRSKKVQEPVVVEQPSRSKSPRLSRSLFTTEPLKTKTRSRSRKKGKK